jgi:oligogalacturonide lyase
VGYGTWVANSACTKMVGIEIAAADWFPLSDWRKFDAMFHKKPLCRLFSIDLASGQRRVILEQQGWLGHPQYRPFDDHTVAYCHEGPHDLIDARMWFINEDGTNRRCGKEHRDGESCTHEFWVPDGSAMIYVSYRKGEAERWIRSLDPVTLADKPLMKMPPCSHLMSNADGTLIVGDGCGQAADAASGSANEMQQGDPFLHLFDLRAGTRDPSPTTTAAGASTRPAARSRTRILRSRPTRGPCSSAPTATASPACTWPNWQSDDRPGGWRCTAWRSWCAAAVACTGHGRPTIGPPPPPPWR